MESVTPQSAVEKNLIKGFRWARALSSTIIAAAITAVTFFGAFDSLGSVPTWSWWALGALLVLGTVAGIGDARIVARAREHASALEQGQRALEEGLATAMSFLLKELGCRNEKTRITVYVHHKSKKVFVPVSRFSDNAFFAEYGRTAYPEDQGVLSVAWAEKRAIKNFSSNPETRKKAFLKMNIPESVFINLKMPSCAMLAVRIDAPGKMGREKLLGVLLIEHVESKGLNRDLMAQFVNDENVPISPAYGTMRAMLLPAVPQLLQLADKRTKADKPFQARP